MINPFINYPFIPESVALLDNYTKTANALGMRVKFYYTVRNANDSCCTPRPVLPLPQRKVPY